MSAYVNDPRVRGLSDEDHVLYVVDDGNGRGGRVEYSMPFWAASWAGERPRRYDTLDEAIRSLIGDPR